jgi:hypothetical protein
LPGFICRRGGSGKTEVHVPALELPSNSFQLTYLNLFEGQTNEEMLKMAQECGIQAAVWGANGFIDGGIKGAVRGAVAGVLSSKDCRDLVKQHYRNKDREAFDKMDRDNYELEEWDSARNTA